jgi:hypothetical protein
MSSVVTREIIEIVAGMQAKALVSTKSIPTIHSGSAVRPSMQPSGRWFRNISSYRSAR